jgi:hypothetical protein
LRTPINVACYGVALAGCVWAVIVLFA